MYASTRSDYYTARSLGRVPGCTTVDIRGYNDDVDTGAQEWVTLGGLPITLQSSAFVASVVSTSANDANPAGTGARIVLVIGLDVNYDVKQEAVAMNGITPVNSVQTFIRIRQMIVISSGTGQKNAGNISCSLNGSLQMSIFANASISETWLYTCPRNKKARFVRSDSWVWKSGTDTIATYYLNSMLFGTNTIVTGARLTSDTSIGVSSTLRLDDVGPVFAEKTDLWTTVECDVNNTKIFIISTIEETDV